jgi:hypothetical protein
MVPAAQSASRILRQTLRIRPTDNPEAFKGQLISHISESEGSKRNREGYRSDTARIRPAGQCQHRGQSAAEETTAWLGW